MTTLSLLAMTGLMGLAVDLGWAFYVKKSAQAAADSAALAAARKVFNAGAGYTCGASVTCWTAITNCPTSAISTPTSNPMLVGCLYGKQNGFTQGGDSGRQTVSLQAGSNSTPPTTPGVTPLFWVTARVSTSIPQLFSAILGNSQAYTSARATAGVVNETSIGSLILLNRENDCDPMGTGGKKVCGVNALIGGTDNLTASGGIIMSSALNSAGCGSGQNDCTGEATGSSSVSAPFTYIRTGGGINSGANWSALPQSKADSASFQDPMRGKGGNPPAYSSLQGSLPNYPITADKVGNGTINGGNSAANALNLPPANYYVVDDKGQPTGGKIYIQGYVHFANGTSSGSGTYCSAGQCMGEYVFYGGMDVSGQNQGVQFDPGRYVFAGVKGTGNPLLNVSANSNLIDGTSSTGRNSDPGELFVLTNASNPSLNVPTLLQPIKASLDYGYSSIQAGTDSKAYVNLHGLNNSSQVVKDLGLDNYAPTVIWQDQFNSTVQYNTSGVVATSGCSTGEDGKSAPSMNNPCATGKDGSTSQLQLQASSRIHLYGVVYQPRGAFTTLTGGNSYSGPIQLITGGLSMQGSANLDLGTISNPLMQTVVALIE